MGYGWWGGETGGRRGGEDGRREEESFVLGRVVGVCSIGVFVRWFVDGGGFSVLFGEFGLFF